MSATSLCFLQPSSFLGSSPQNYSVSFAPKVVGAVPLQRRQTKLLVVEAKSRTRGEDRTARHSRIRKKVIALPFGGFGFFRLFRYECRYLIGKSSCRWFGYSKMEEKKWTWISHCPFYLQKKNVQTSAQKFVLETKIELHSSLIERYYCSIVSF